MSPETKAKSSIKKLVEGLAAKYKTKINYRATPAGALGATGRPDGFVVIRGVLVEIEVKAGRNKPTRLQELWLRETASAGGYGFVIWGDDEAELKWLETTLLQIIEGKAKVPHIKTEKVKS